MSAEDSVTAETDIDIVNTALVNMGQNPVTDFGQQSGTGIILQASYNRSRNDLLRKQPWNFARKWVSLSLLAQAPVNLDFMPETAGGPGLVSFINAFQLPTDCLRVFRFSPKNAHWRIVGRQIYTDAVPATNVGPLLGLEIPNTNGGDNVPGGGQFGAPIAVGIEYIQQVTDPQIWDANFRQCFVWKLQKEMSMGITGLAQMYKVAKDEYDQSMADASVVNGLENWPDEWWETDLATVRYGYVGVTIEGY